MQQPHSKDLRRGRISEPGQIYLITAVTWNRAPIFRDISHARRASRICHSPSAWKGANCLAWVLMPDHWHGLVELREGDISRVVARYKALVSSAVKRSSGRKSPVWQKSFQDRALRKDDDIVAAARYLVANPLRAGLVDRIGNYPYWNAVWL
ncbi:transposase [Luteibacter jiangsuensis]|uniref:Transposase n=1 Tax=Luteibacter jiangsuensis TaxID=637577 RepID=A0ABX0Q9J8_9GAMM|nr:transposase [Luteibacter jiangsuensis]NID06967.1 transposase [Luteibacter jiangsuensis]